MKAMIIFIVVCLLLVTFSYVGWRIVRRFSYPLSYFLDAANFERQLKNGPFDVVNVGSNTAKYAFDWSSCGIQGGNFAFVPQSATYDFEILRKIERQLKPHAVVVMPVFPLSSVFEPTYPKGRIRYFAKYYAVLTKDEIAGFSIREKIRTWITLNLCHRNWCEQLKDDPLAHAEAICDDQMLVKRMTGHTEAWKKYFEINDFSQLINDRNRKPFEWNVNVYQRMIDWCVERGHRPVFVLLPIGEKFDDVLPKCFYEHYVFDFIRKIDRPQIPVYDYRFLSPCRERKCFVDGLVMSELGRSLFTRTIVERLREDGLLNGGGR